MDVQNYNVGLAKNRAKYQETADEARAKYKKDLEFQKSQADANFNELKQEKIKQNRDLQQDYSVKLSDDQRRMQKELEKQSGVLTEKISKKQEDHSKYDQTLRNAHRRELQKVKNAFELQNETVPIEKLNQAKRNQKSTEKYYSSKLEEINNRNSATVEQLQEDLRLEKESLVKLTDETIEKQAVGLNKQYQKKSEDTIEAYETRIRNKDTQIENLLFRMNTLSKKLSERFTRDLNEKLKLKDEILNQERLEMKKAKEDLILNHAVKNEDQRRTFDAKLHEISIRNEKDLDNVIRRYERQIEQLNKEHKEDFTTKVRELETIISNLKTSQKLEMAGTREYYDHRLRKMQERLSEKQGNKSVGVRVVSK